MAEFTVSRGTGDPTIPDGVSNGRVVDFFGLTGTVTGVSVSLTNLSHAFPDDLDFALVAPDSRNLVFLSDAGGNRANSISNISLTISDFAPTQAPDSAALTSGLYKPTNYDANETTGSLGFMAPAITHAGPAGGATFASAFGGSAPNGRWWLHYTDDSSGDVGSVQGFSLTITTSSNAVVINGDFGSDTIAVAATGASSGFYSLYKGIFSTTQVVQFSGVTSFRLNGAGGSDTINGSTFSEVLDGGTGSDTLRGGGGNDTYVLGAEATGTDSVFDSGGTADLILTTISRNLGSYATIENLTLLGTAAITGVGNALANIITGNAAANVLSGLAGNDRLYGAAGRDTLSGGIANDVLVYRSVLDSRGTLFDAVQDFDDFGNDTIDLSLVYAGRLTFVSGNFTGAGQVHIRDLPGADLLVEVNTGGTLAADMVIRLTSTTAVSMTGTDFVL